MMHGKNVFGMMIDSMIILSENCWQFELFVHGLHVLSLLIFIVKKFLLELPM